MTGAAAEFIKGAKPGTQFTFGPGDEDLANELEGYGYIERTGKRVHSAPLYRFTKKVERFQ